MRATLVSLHRLKPALWGLTALTGLLANSALALPTDLGDYGSFLGTWSGNISQGQGGGGDELEGLLVDAYPALEPFASLGTGVNQLNLAGKVDPPPGENGRLDVAVTTFKGNEGVGGTWEYLFDTDPNAPPGNEPIDFYLVVKTNTFFSVFYYPTVVPGDTGLWSTDPTVLGVSICTDTDGLVGADCVPMNTNPQTPQPFGISHVEAYWPPIAGEMPEPGTSALIGVGLLASWLLRRRRSA